MTSHLQIRVSTAKACDVTPASLKPTTLGGAIEEMNISGEHPALVARHCDREPRTRQFSGRNKKHYEEKTREKYEEERMICKFAGAEAGGCPMPFSPEPAR